MDKKGNSWEKGGFIIPRHNEIRGVIVKLPSELWKYVRGEQSLLKSNREKIYETNRIKE